MLHTATDQAFLETILDAPDDDAPRLIYADWLDEQGESDRAEFIRLQVRAARLPSDDPARRAVEARADELRQGQHVEWVNRLPLLPGVHWQVFHRGLISTVRFDDPDAFFTHAADVFATAPVQELWLHQFYHVDATRLAGVRHLRRVRILDLNDGNRIGNKGVEDLMQSRHLGSLRELKLGRNALGSAGVRAIAMSGYVRHLKRLKLEKNDLFDDGLRYLAESSALSGLEQLDLERTRTGDDGVKALARSRHLRGLRLLDLSNNLVTDAGLVALAGSDAVSVLRDFFLHGNAITDVGAAALAGAEPFGRLERVFLRQNQIRDDGALALARSPHLGNLRELYLGDNRISDLAADALRARFRSGVNLY